MPMLAAGSSRKFSGFTLLELLIVITIIAIGTAGVTFAFRDSQSSLLEREAQRLIVVLETARVQSRSSGVALTWLPLPQGYVVIPESEVMQAFSSGRELALNDAVVNPWLTPQLRVQIATASGDIPSGSQRSTSRLLLGAEPMIAPAVVLIGLGDRQLRIATDGLRPFAVEQQAAAVSQP